MIAKVVQRLRRRLDKLAECTHRTKLFGDVTVDSETMRLQVPTDVRKRPYVCLDCLTKETIVCACCGKPIFHGDSVVLRILADEQVIAAGARMYNQGRQNEALLYVCCLRSTCADIKGKKVGVWAFVPELKRCAVTEVVHGRAAFGKALANSRHHK